MKKYIQDLYRRKDLIIYLVTSGLKAQHKNSYLGYFWWLLDPLLNVLVYFFVVVIVFHRGGPDYGIFLVIGIIVWRWFSSTVSFASRSIVSQANIISQVNLPKAIFPIGVTITQLINCGFGLVVIGIFLIFLKISPGIEIIWLPFIITSQLIFTMALAFPIAFISVFVRDVDNIINHILRLWFFGSPVIWRSDMIPEKVRWILDINPMYYFLSSYRKVLMYNSSPDYIMLLFICIVSIIFVFLMINYYSQFEYKIIKSL